MKNPAKNTQGGMFCFLKQPQPLSIDLLAIAAPVCCSLPCTLSCLTLPSLYARAPFLCQLEGLKAQLQVRLCQTRLVNSHIRNQREARAWAGGGARHDCFGCTLAVDAFLTQSSQRLLHHSRVQGACAGAWGRGSDHLGLHRQALLPHMQCSTPSWLPSSQSYPNVGAGRDREHGSRCVTQVPVPFHRRPPPLRSWTRRCGGWGPRRAPLARCWTWAAASWGASCRAAIC